MYVEIKQSEEFNMKESRRYNVSVLMNHLQDLEKMLFFTLDYLVFQFFFIMLDFFQSFTSITEQKILIIIQK